MGLERISTTPLTLVGEGQTCTDCGRQFARVTPSGRCHGCDTKERIRQVQAAEAAQRAEEIAAVMGRLDAYLDERLTACGMARKELRATLDRIPRGVKLAQPPEAVRALLRGEVPEQGWGLIGTTGTGKTMALAAIIRAHARAALEARVPKEGPIGVEWIRWESVPALVDFLRDNARSNPDLVATRVAAASTAQILILDDLAAERRISDYGSDYAIGKLDLIIDARDRACLPTWYTANVEGEIGLTEAYGARLVSRLCGCNPPALVEGEDMRMR